MIKCTILCVIFILEKVHGLQIGLIEPLDFGTKTMKINGLLDLEDVKKLDVINSIVNENDGSFTAENLSNPNKLSFELNLPGNVEQCFKIIMLQ